MHPQPLYRDALPNQAFFIFGAGGRRKLLYRRGVLSDALTNETVHTWQVADETITPDAYTVELTTPAGERIVVREDEDGVWLEHNGERVLLAAGAVRLPRFENHPHAALLRVLHHEILVNIVDGKPVPNLFVYARPWIRDAAMMALVLERIGNVALIADWVLQLRDPFDRNNGGDREADNLGQALFLVSLVGDASHPLVQTVLDTLPQYERDGHIVGLSDFAERPVYQTKWLKYGLRRLQLPDPYEIPAVEDQYAALFWMDYRDQYVAGPPFSQHDGDLYPYLAWAKAHFHGWEPPLHLLAQHYPLTWEAEASYADYDGIVHLDPAYRDKRVCMPHTWHAAEAFLYLLERAA